VEQASRGVKMNNSAKELCYKTKLTVIKSIIEMSNEDVLECIKEAVDNYNSKKARNTIEMQNMRQKNEAQSRKPSGDKKE
jgi:ectoine hydroxylase-related dioxygenase (phytanoyl-CoA dioxygenase family)